jgi:para-aminobenzoate synthetase component I
MGGQWARGLVEVTHDLSALDGTGRWAVAIPYVGEPICARFETWSADAAIGEVGPWQGPSVAAWDTSLDEASYLAAVESIRDAIAVGTVYQANICRVMSARMPDAAAADIGGLAALLQGGNPAPYGGFLRLPDSGVAIASASPELFLSVVPSSDGRRVRSGPIKGTGRTTADLTDKDVAENIMIVDLVRNDLSRVSRPGTVAVPGLLRVEEHPGLVHLVSYVEGLLTPETRWIDLIEATFPPGSVTGAPKLSALDLIASLESAEREYYCGAFGWVDADNGQAELAVAIRTFWLRDGVLRFGTGAGITWGSDPRAEWQETELKAARLVEVASGAWQGGWS